MSTTLAMFHECDVNDSGVVDCEEFQLMMQRLNAPMTAPEVRAAFVAIDSDNDGYIQYGELQMAIQTYRRSQLAPRLRSEASRFALGQENDLSPARKAVEEALRISRNAKHSGRDEPSAEVRLFTKYCTTLVHVFDRVVWAVLHSAQGSS